MKKKHKIKKKYKIIKKITKNQRLKICEMINKYGDEALDEAKVRQLEIVCSRFLEGMKLREIGAKYGICRERVRQILKNFLLSFSLEEEKRQEIISDDQNHLKEKKEFDTIKI